MKLIQAVVRPDKLDALKNALEEACVPSITVFQVRFRGPEKREMLAFRGYLQEAEYAEKLEIELAVPDDEVDRIVGAIIRTARTGVPGDGHISVMSIDHRYAIHNGQRDVC